MNVHELVSHLFYFMNASLLQCQAIIFKLTRCALCQRAAKK